VLRNAVTIFKKTCYSNNIYVGLDFFNTANREIFVMQLPAQALLRLHVDAQQSELHGVAHE
jgi:hypothetical protein